MPAFRLSHNNCPDNNKNDNVEYWRLVFLKQVLLISIFLNIVLCVSFSVTLTKFDLGLLGLCIWLPAFFFCILLSCNYLPFLLLLQFIFKTAIIQFVISPVHFMAKQLNPSNIISLIVPYTFFFFFGVFVCTLASLIFRHCLWCFRLCSVWFALFGAHDSPRDSLSFLAPHQMSQSLKCRGASV